MQRAAFSLLLALAAPAVLSGAAWSLPFSATLTVQYTSEATLSVGASGTSVDGAAGAFDLPAGVFSGGDGPVNTGATAPPLAAAELRGVSSGAGSFVGGAGSMAVNGELLHFFFQPLPGFEIPVPLVDLGVGGTTPISVLLPGFPLTVNGLVTGDAWTTGAIAVTGSSQTLTTAGFDARALDGTGAVRFVAPLEVELELGSGPFTFPGYGALDFVFTPEPGTLLLVGSALVALALARGRPASRS